ncbi:MAG: heme-binding protein, partial [Rhodospirillales bacterium]
MSLTLETANKIVEVALAKGHELGLNPLTVAILDAGGTLKVLAREDGTSTLRPGIAQGTA